MIMEHYIRFVLCYNILKMKTKNGLFQKWKWNKIQLEQK